MGGRCRPGLSSCVLRAGGADWWSTGDTQGPVDGRTRDSKVGVQQGPQRGQADHRLVSGRDSWLTARSSGPVGTPFSWCWVPASRSHWSRGFRPVSLRRALLGAWPVPSGRQSLLAPRSSSPRSRLPAPLLARGPWSSLPDAALCKAAVAPRDTCGARSLRPGTVGLFSHWRPGGHLWAAPLGPPLSTRLPRGPHGGAVSRRVGAGPGLWAAASGPGARFSRGDSRGASSGGCGLSGAAGGPAPPPRATPRPPSPPPRATPRPPPPSPPRARPLPGPPLLPGMIFFS